MMAWVYCKQKIKTKFQNINFHPSYKMTIPEVYWKICMEVKTRCIAS